MSDLIIPEFTQPQVRTEEVQAILCNNSRCHTECHTCMFHIDNLVEFSKWMSNRNGTEGTTT